MGRALTTRGAVMVALATATALLSGCAPTAPPAAEPPPTISQPIFASDEEALAAAEAAYARYLAVSDQIAQDGGKNPERIDALAESAARDLVYASAQQYIDANAHLVGSTVLSSVELQESQTSIDGRATISIYACVDVSNVDVINQDGDSLVTGSRPDKQAFEVLMAGASAGSLLVESQDVWTGESICTL